MFLKGDFMGYNRSCDRQSIALLFCFVLNTVAEINFMFILLHEQFSLLLQFASSTAEVASNDQLKQEDHID